MTQPIDRATADRLISLWEEVLAEFARQRETWGDQTHPDGTDQRYLTLEVRDQAQRLCKRAAANGTVTWRHIAHEEIAEAFCETEPGPLRVELVQTIAVLFNWAQDLDRRTNPTT